jgi:hypothetical protein
MKKLRISLICLFLFLYCTDGWSQKITTGYYGGVNISDIHGGTISGKWKFKPGPVQGLYLDYSFNRIFGFRTGINYSTLNYEHITGYQDYGYYPLGYSSVIWPGPYYAFNEFTDFSFISFPAQIRLSVPSVPRLDLMAGIYNAFLIDHSEIYNNIDYTPSKYDFGYLYSIGLSLPLTDRLEASLNARYITGRKGMDNYNEAWHGSMDFTFGVAWKGILKSKSGNADYQLQDSVSEKIYLVYGGGINASWNSGEMDKERYSLNYGPSLGLLVNFRLSGKTSFRTGVAFDVTGYSLQDSSDSFNRYIITDEAYYHVDTKTSVDYLTIPLLISFHPGHGGRFFINTGPFAAIKLNARCRGPVYYNLESSGSYSRYRRIVNDDLEGAIKDNNFGWIIEGGLTTPLFGRLALEYGFQYRRGFGEVYDESYLPANESFFSDGTVFENSSLSFRIGVRVPVKVVK